MSEDPFERHEDEIKKSLVIALYERENLKGCKPSLDIIHADAKELYGSAAELKVARNIFLDYVEIEKITSRLENDEVLGYEFVNFPAHFGEMNLPVRVYWLMGFASPELKAVHWDRYDGRKILEKVPEALVSRKS